MEQVVLNKWEQLFESFLDLTEFSLIYYKAEEKWGVWDRQGANLGGIQEDRFECAKEIFERMEVYINDYFFEDLLEEVNDYGIELPSREYMANKYIGMREEILTFNIYCTAYWIAFRSEFKYKGREKREYKFLQDHEFEFDVMEMIRYHADEINLKNIYHEEE